jgi:hypothetical protein
MGRKQGGRVVQQDIIYSPLPSQKRFHKLKARFKGFSGPIGSGKSQALVNEAVKLSYVNAGRTGLIGAPTYPMLRDSTQTSFFELLAGSDVPFEFHKAENVVVMKHTQSKVLFRSLEDFERLRGTNLAWFGIDELTYAPEEAWLRLQGRLRDPKATVLSGVAVWTPKGFDWVYRRFLSEPREDHEVVIARAGENHHMLDKIPDFYERLRSSYDELFYRQEVLGEYLNLAGDRVYHAFDRGVNVRPGEPDRGKALLWALDFNVDPMCSIVAQRSAKEFTVLDEIILRRATTQEACAEFRSRYGGWASGIIVYGDASGTYRKTSGLSDYSIIRNEFSSAGIRNVQYRMPASNPLVRDRVNLLNAKLRSADGNTALFIDPKCKELILDLEQVSYKANSFQIDKTADPRRTHLSDALGYLIWQECGDRPTIGERCERIL